MEPIDWEKQRLYLRDRYAGMEDGELEQLAASLDSLTTIARDTLTTELSKRGIAIPEKTTTSKLVMIRRYRDLPEAQIASSILDSAGIESFLVDENLVRLDWFYSNLVGGIKLQVREDDAEAAGKLLEQEIPEKFEVEGVGEYEQPKCPRCGSRDVALDELNKPIAWGASYLVGLPIAIHREGGKCNACGYTWEDESGQEPPATESTPRNTPER
jgi:Putative prokaryotic signal transducing protein